MAQLIAQPHGDLRLGDFLNQHLQDPEWTAFKAAVAFVKYSGARQIEQNLAGFSRRGEIKLAVGVDCLGTSAEGLTALMNAVGDRGEIWIFHNETEATFHPKLYSFSGATRADVIVGSGNLTAGGLFTNYEASLALRLEFANAADLALFRQMESLMDRWTSPAEGTALRLDAELLERLAVGRYIVNEAQQAEDAEEGGLRANRRVVRAREEALFRRVAVPAAPPAAARARAGRRIPPPVVLPGVRAASAGFVMTLQQTDAGYGQTTRGTTRRSPEIFVPLAARNFAPEFWGWQDQFVEDPARPGKWDRHGVRVRIGAEIVPVNMMTWPIKHDFRLRSERLRSAGAVGDILRIEKVEGVADYEYIAEVVPQASSEYAYYDRLCDQAVRNSDKRWGYYL